MFISSLRDWLARNHQWFLGAILITVCVLTAMIPGCGLLDPVVSVPKEVQTTLGAPPTVPLSESKAIFEDYKARCELRVQQDAATLHRFGASINEAETTADNWRAALWLGIEQGQAAAGTALPPLAPILSVLTLIAGIAIPKPGTKKKIEKAYVSGEVAAASKIASASDPVSTARQIAQAKSVPASLTGIVA